MGLGADYSIVYDGTGNTNKLSYTHTGLTAGLTYSYYLEVLNFNGPSAASPETSRASCEVPSGFTSVNESSTSQTSIKVGWA